MVNMKIKNISFYVLLFFAISFFPCIFLDSSIVNPDLAPELPGYDDFFRGRGYFNEKNWDESIHFFTEAIKRSEEPSIACSNYLTRNGCSSVCHYFNEDIKGYVIRNARPEIAPAIYRHAHFYLGLIHLHQENFTKANLHFKKAIGFSGHEDEMMLQFYKCANIINPSWIALASLTKLHDGNFEEAKELARLAWWTIENSEDILDKKTWEHVDPKYWQDLKKRGITSDKWSEIQCIILFCTESIIATAQNDLKGAIYFISQAILYMDYAIKKKCFPEKSEDHCVLYFNRGLLYSKVGNYQEALIDFTKAIELSPADAEIYSTRGDIYLILEDYSNAFDDYLQAIKLDSNNPKYYRQMALAHAIIGSIEKMKQELELAEINENKLNSLENELGFHEFSTGSFQKAIDHFNQFIKLNPSLSIGYQNRGATLYQTGKLKEAIEDYDEAIRLDPTCAELYQMRAIAFIFLSALNEGEENCDLIEAETNLLHALEIDPNDVKIYQNLATCYSLSGNSDAAIECYEKALKLKPAKDHPHLLKNLALIYFERGENKKALVNCEKAIQLGCKDRKMYLIQGHCLFESNQFKQAIQKYDLAVNLGCDDPNLYFNRAQAYFCLNQFDLACSDANRVLKANPAHVECYKLRGLIFLSMHKQFEAYSDFRMAIRLSSADLFIDNNLFSNQNQTRITELTLNKNIVFQLSDTFLSDLSIFKPLLRLFSGKKVVPYKLSQIQINLDSFGKGLVDGVMEGGVETLKEIGPFFAN